MPVIEVNCYNETIDQKKQFCCDFVEFLKDSLDTYVSKLPVKTIVLRQALREGLVAARLLGAKNAKGEVM